TGSTPMPSPMPARTRWCGKPSRRRCGRGGTSLSRWATRPRRRCERRRPSPSTTAPRWQSWPSSGVPARQPTTTRPTSPGHASSTRIWRPRSGVIARREGTTA
ncbi:MAG: hypothetical protein AVDCRST_MAG15-2556, partial [uncultured Rubellimicrobium sp.]